MMNSNQYSKLTIFLATLVLFSSNAFLVSGAYSAHVTQSTLATGSSTSSSKVEVATANYGSDSVTIASGHKVAGTVSVGFEPLGQIGWDGKYFWVANYGSDSVSLIKASDNRVAKAITGFDGPAAVIYDPGNHFVYVADFPTNTVYPVNDTTLAVGQGISVGSAPEFMTYSPVTNDVYVANQEGTTVSVINLTNNVVATIAIGNPGDGLSGITYASSTKSIYVIDYDEFAIYQINSHNKVVNFGAFSSYLWNIAFDQKNGMLYATEIDTGQIIVVNPKTLMLKATITCPTSVCPQEASPIGVDYDSQNGLIYVADDSNSILIPINGTKIVTPVIPTGAYPQGVTAGNPV